jgi:hypothetical protein
VAKHRNIIRGKIVASRKSRPWWILWVHGCPCVICGLFVHQKCSNYALTNLVIGLCASMWIIELLVIFLSPILELQHTHLPLKCCKPGSAPQLFLFLLSSPLDSQLRSSRSLGVHQHPTMNGYPYHQKTIFGHWWMFVIANPIHINIMQQILMKTTCTMMMIA